MWSKSGQRFLILVLVLPNFKEEKEGQIVVLASNIYEHVSRVYVSSKKNNNVE